MMKMIFCKFLLEHLRHSKAFLLSAWENCLQFTTHRTKGHKAKHIQRFIEEIDFKDYQVVSIWNKKQQHKKPIHSLYRRNERWWVEAVSNLELMQKPFQVCSESYFMEELQRTPVLATQSSLRKVYKRETETKAPQQKHNYKNDILFI